MQLRDRHPFRSVASADTFAKFDLTTAKGNYEPPLIGERLPISNAQSSIS